MIVTDSTLVKSMLDNENLYFVNPGLFYFNIVT